MARELSRTNLEGRDEKRKAQAAKAIEEATQEFIAAGGEHRFEIQGATREDKLPVAKKEVIPRKDPGEYLEKKLIRMHPRLIAAIEAYAEANVMDFAKASRDLILKGLRADGLGI